MPFYHKFFGFSRVFIILVIVFSLTACDYFSKLIGSHDDTVTSENINAVPFTLAVAPNVAWMPWYLANEEGIFERYKSKYGIDIQFIEDDYLGTINKFITGEADAIMITNIDAIAQLVRRDIKADVILIANVSDGNDAILLHNGADPNIQGKKIGVLKDSFRQYLLDRYLIKNQLDFDSITIVNKAEVDMIAAFNSDGLYGVVTGNPNLSKLLEGPGAKVLFDSREISGEIFDMLIVNRTKLQENPEFAQTLLRAWFAIMDRFQGNRRTGTLDAMARLLGMTRADYEQQIAMVKFEETALGGLSAIRAGRTMKKIMRHVRYFVERNNLASEEMFNEWVSYPGRVPAILHFNAGPLQEFIYKR